MKKYRKIKNNAIKKIILKELKRAELNGSKGSIQILKRYKKKYV